MFGDNIPICQRGPLACFIGRRGPMWVYRVTSPIRKRNPLGPYRSPMPRALWWTWILMRELTLYWGSEGSESGEAE